MRVLSACKFTTFGPGVLRDQKRASDPPTGLTEGCESPCGCWVSNSSGGVACVLNPESSLQHSKAILRAEHNVFELPISQRESSCYTLQCSQDEQFTTVQQLFLAVSLKM